MKVVVTRERGHNESLRALVPEGCDVAEVPLTETKYYDPAEVAAALARWRDVDFRTWVVTSARSEPYFELVAHALGAHAQVFSVGEATTRTLIAHGVTVSGEAQGGAEELDALITKGPVLVLGAKVMRSELSEALHKRGLRIEHLACYETVALAPDSAGMAALRAAQVVFVGAPSAWRTAQEFITSSAWVVVPGATTAAAVRAQHERVIEGWGPELLATLRALDH
ncbi:MAG: uroporphyrinogen-III synthase [Acidobacteria bacterium]|nr:uroporphyrinogen-III synthase [Acidobacteriota bacterium]